MSKDFEPIIVELPPKDLKVYCISDVHIGARECDIKGFKKLVDKIAVDDSAYCLIVGDLINNAVKTSVSNVYEEELSPHEQVEEATKILAPISHKILAGVAGNHELRSAKDVDLDPFKIIFWNLGIEDRYRENVAFLRIKQHDDCTQKHQSTSFALFHGKSASKRKQMAYAIEGVNFIVTGHTHEGLIEKPSHICFQPNDRIIIRDVYSIVATSWLKYDEGGYSVRNMYAPKATSCPQYINIGWATCQNKPELSVTW